MTSTPRAARNARDEITTVPRLFEQAQALTTLGDLPLVVLTASEQLGDGRLGGRAGRARRAVHQPGPPRGRLEPPGPGRR